MRCTVISRDGSVKDGLTIWPPPPSRPRLSGGIDFGLRRALPAVAARDRHHLLRNDRRAETWPGTLGRLGRSTGASGSPEPGDALPLGEMLGGLAREQRDVLLLYAWEELSYEEIAAALGIPVGTVRSRLSRARAQLRAALGGETADTTTEEVNG